jgi:methionyl-tRNA synthetase
MSLFTTAIAYTNGDPHIGHLYEVILADFISKVSKMVTPTFLLTGTDEHGKKIENTAKSLGIVPRSLCDEKSLLFKKMCDHFQVKYDYFVRTTDESHKDVVKDAIFSSFSQSDIYKDKYDGWYSTREESFVTEKQAKEDNYNDPVSGIPYEKLSEETYNFRLSKFSDNKDDLNIIVPQNMALTCLPRLTNLKDLCITRPLSDTHQWGIPFPLDKNFLVYVWFDALLNYVSGCKKMFDSPPEQIFHVIGKDIVWFHAVIYPAILRSSGLDKYLPKRILVHGFVVDEKGNKMSKSVGNVVSVSDIKSKYSIDAIRFYLICETTLGEDIPFSEKRLVELYNNELIKDYGNLFQRIMGIVRPYQDKIGSIDVGSSVSKICKEFLETYNIKWYKKQIFDRLFSCNALITKEQPNKKEMEPEKRLYLIKTILTYFHESSLLLQPIIPEKIDELYSFLGTKLSFCMEIKIPEQQGKVKAFKIYE